MKPIYEASVKKKITGLTWEEAIKTFEKLEDCCPDLDVELSAEKDAEGFSTRTYCILIVEFYAAEAKNKEELIKRTADAFDNLEEYLSNV